MKVGINTELFICRYVDKKANIQQRVEEKNSSWFWVKNSERVRKFMLFFTKLSSEYGFLDKNQEINAYFSILNYNISKNK